MVGGGSTNTLKIFRPVPSYFVSSLAFSKSRCSVGSSDDAPLAFFPVDRVRELFLDVGGAGWLDNSAALGTVWVADAEVTSEDPPPKNVKKRVAASPSASTPSATAAISFVRFSAPTFTTL